MVASTINYNCLKFKLMDITSRIETRKDRKAICVRLTGDYQTLNYTEAWDKLGKFCRDNHIDYNCPNAEYINIYHDNPAATPPDQCRTDVCIAASAVEHIKPTADVGITTISGGRYLVYRYQGPYENLGAANAKIYGELLPNSGEKVKEGNGVIEPCPMFERYLNDPDTTRPNDLLTEIWIPVE